MDTPKDLHYRISTMKTSSLIFTLAILTFAGFTPERAAPEPTSATEAVFFAYGVIDAEIEAVSIEAAKIAYPSPIVIVPHFSFRIMASLARQMAFAFAFDGYILGYWYFEGRAAAFEQIADLAEEPRY